MVVDWVAGSLGLGVERVLIGDFALAASSSAIVALLALSLRSVGRAFGWRRAALVLVGGLGKLGLVVMASLLVAYPYAERLEYYEVPQVNATAAKLTVMLDVSHSMKESLPKAAKFIASLVERTNASLEVIPWADYPLLNETVVLTQDNLTKFSPNRTKPYTSLGNALLYLYSNNVSRAIIITDGGDNGLVDPREIAERLCEEGAKVLLVHVDNPKYPWSEEYLGSLGSCFKYVKLIDVEDPFLLSKVVEYSARILYGSAKVPVRLKDYEGAYNRILPVLLALLAIGVAL